MATTTQQILREAGFIKKPKQLEKPMTRISGGPVDSLAWILRGVDLDEFKNKEKSKKEQSRETGKEDSTPGFEPDFTHKIARLYVQSIYQLTSTQSMSSLSNTFLGDKEIPDLEYLQRFISTYCQVNLNSHFTLQSVMLVGLANILSFTKLFSVRANLDKTSMQKNGLDPVLASELTSYLNEFASNHTRICETEIPPLESSLLEEAKTRWTMTKSRHSRHRSERLDSPGRVKSPKTKENTEALPSVTKQVVTGTNEHSVLSPTAVNTPATKIQLFDFSGQAVSQHNRGKSVPVKPKPEEELTRQSALLRKDSDDSPVVRHKKKEDLIDATSIFPRSPRLAPDPLVQPATRMQTVPAALAVYLPKQLHRSLNGLQLALAEAKTQREELYKALAELDVMKQWAKHRELTIQALQDESLMSMSGLGTTSSILKDNKQLKDINHRLKSENKALLRENEELQTSQTHCESILRKTTGRDVSQLLAIDQGPNHARSMSQLGSQSQFGKNNNPEVQNRTGLGANNTLHLGYNTEMRRTHEDQFLKTSKKVTGMHHAALRFQEISGSQQKVHQVTKSTQTPSFAILNATQAAAPEVTPMWNKSAGRFKSVSKISYGAMEDGGTPRSIRAQQTSQQPNRNKDESMEERDSKQKVGVQTRDHIRLFLGSALATSIPHPSMSEFKTVLERYEKKRSRVEGLFYLILRHAKRLIVTCGGESVLQKSSSYTTSPHVFVHVIFDTVMEKDIRQGLPVAAWILKEFEMYKKLDTGCAYLLACIMGNVGPLDQTSKLARLGQDSEGSHLAGRILEIEGIMMLAKIRIQDSKEEKERSTQSQENMELVQLCEEIIYEKVKAIERFASGLQSVLDALHTSEVNEESELWQTASIQHAILNLEEIVKVLFFSLAKAEYTSKQEGFSRKQRFSGAWVTEVCKWIIPELILMRVTPGLPFKAFVPLLYPYLPLLLSMGSQSSCTLSHSDDYYRCHEPGKENDHTMENYYKQLLRS